MDICGINFEIGQRWRENDKRFVRIVEVVGWQKGLQRIQIRSTGSYDIKTTWADAHRFDGRSGGYALETGTDSTSEAAAK